MTRFLRPFQFCVAFGRSPGGHPEDLPSAMQDQNDVYYSLNVHDKLCSDDVKSSVKYLRANKACGLDNLFAEHLLYASPSIHALLSICFNDFIVQGFCLVI